MVKVYRWRVYDVTTDEVRTSRRMATREAAERWGGAIMVETGTEVSEADVGREIEGMTERDFYLYTTTELYRRALGGTR